MDPRDTADAPLDLPPLDDDGGDESIEDADAWSVALPDTGGGDPFDDSYASDLPLELELTTVSEASSAIGDDSVGVEDNHSALAPLDSGESFIDEGGSPDSQMFEGDDELGIDPIPREQDDGGLEGLEDEAGVVELKALPPLDGTDEDEEELDVGLHLPENLPPVE